MNKEFSHEMGKVIESTAGLDKTPWSGLDNKMFIGDIDSRERGSGARANENKLAVEQIPVRCWRKIFAHQVRRMPDPNAVYLSQLLNLVDALAEFQEGTASGSRLLCDVPMQWTHDAIEVFVYGMGKYKRYNWLKGQAWSVPLASALRHAKSVFGGEVVDPESGLAHTGHFVCNLIMLATFYDTYPEGNDFPNPEWMRRA